MSIISGEESRHRYERLCFSIEEEKQSLNDLLQRGEKGENSEQVFVVRERLLLLRGQLAMLTGALLHGEAGADAGSLLALHEESTRSFLGAFRSFQQSRLECLLCRGMRARFLPRHKVS